MENLEYLKSELEKERTARIAAEQKIGELSSFAGHMKTLMMALQTGIMVEDENRRILLVNQSFCDLFGIGQNPDQLIGLDCSNSAEEFKYLFSDPDNFVKTIETCLSERKTILSDELTLLDGRCFKRDYVPVFLEGNYRGHLWNYRDVTDRKNSETRLKLREEKYRRIIENMNLGLLEVDLEGKIQYANQSFCSMSGYNSDQLIGIVAEDLLMRDSEKDKRTILEKNQLRAKGVHDAYEVKITTASGEVKWWLISGAPLYNDNCILVGSIGIHLDITMQKDLELNLTEAKKLAEETARAKEVFLANMSHEIRTPMNAILGLGSQLMKTNLDPMQETFLNAINTAGDNLLVIINDILDFSKIEAGKMHIEKTGFDLRALLLHTKEIFSQNIQSKGLDFQIDTDDEIAPVLIGDPFRVNQIILNLLSNSVKFTEQGSIRLECHIAETTATHQHLVITVQDSGIGMDSNFLENIFKKFSQENINNSRKYGGTGLGMAITHQLVVLMNGTIEIESQKGLGTKVFIRISFPIGTAGEVPAKENMAVDLKLLSGKKILLVEDNQINRLVARTILTNNGVMLTEAVNGQLAIDLFVNHSFDLVLMDMQMPVLDGLTATTIIREQFDKNVPIIALTANALKGERDKCMAAGMNDFISKPFDESKLLQVILKYLP